MISNKQFGLFLQVVNSWAEVALTAYCMVNDTRGSIGDIKGMGDHLHGKIIELKNSPDTIPVPPSDHH